MPVAIYSQDAAAPERPAPDKLSDPKLTSLLTHPGIKYIAQSQEPLLQKILPLIYHTQSLMEIQYFSTMYSFFDA